MPLDFTEMAEAGVNQISDRNPESNAGNDGAAIATAGPAAVWPRRFLMGAIALTVGACMISTLGFFWPILWNFGYPGYGLAVELMPVTLVAAASLWLAERGSTRSVSWICGVLIVLSLTRLALGSHDSPVHNSLPGVLKILWRPGITPGKGAAFTLILFSSGLLLFAHAKATIRMLWGSAFLGSAVAAVGLISLMVFASGLYLAPFWETSFLKVAVPTAVIFCSLGFSLVALYLGRSAGSDQQLSVSASLMAALVLMVLFAGVDPAVLASSDYILKARLEVHKILEQLDAIRSVAADAREAESAQRGFVLTGEQEYLQEFRIAQAKFARMIHEGSIPDPNLLTSAELAYNAFGKAVESERLGHHAEAVEAVRTGHALHLIEHLEQDAATQAAGLRRIIENRRNGGYQSASSVRKMILFSYGMSLVLVACAILLAGTEIRRRSRMEREIRENEARLAQINAALREQTARAEEASVAKSSFLSSMSHEIRTPMNAILGMADMLWESELSPTQRHYVEVFRRAGGTLLNLINHILDLSKIESGNFLLEKVDFHLRDLVEQVMEMLSPIAESKALSLVGHIEPGTAVSVIGDPVRLQQILLNLLGNAVKFTDQGTVLLRVHSQSTETSADVTFEISDTGIGIAADKLQLIFEDFAQAEASTTRRFGGTGLGLSISKRLVTLMGGDLQVRSELGRGTTFCFTVTFPIGAEQASSTLMVPEEIHGKAVLIVDNNEMNRVVLTEMCSAWGMEVTGCNRGVDAVDAVRRSLNVRPFSLALVDRMMPGLDGFETARQIQLLDPKTAILLISSDSQSGDVARCRELDLAGHLMKPIRRAELLQKIVRALSNAPEPAHAIEAWQAPAPTGRRVHVLVAEDSEDNRFLLQAYCKGTNYDLTFAADGERALEAYRESNFDIVLMDLLMPVLDGLTATREIRALEGHCGRKHTPILALTANALLQDATTALEAGCDAHLAKPITRRDLLQALDKWTASPPSATGAQYELEIPEGLEELARSYLQARQQELAQLKELAQSCAFTELRELGHRMKGSGTSFGFPDITRLGATIEQASKEGNAPHLAKQLSELSTYLDAVSERVLGV